MAVSYKKLWKLLIDKDMIKKTQRTLYLLNSFSAIQYMIL